MEARHKLTISSLYQYVFEDRARPDVSPPKKMDDTSMQKMLASQAVKQAKKKDEFEDLLYKADLSNNFRLMLRKLGSQSLELLLYSDTTDDLLEPPFSPEKYYIPSDDEIMMKFYDLDQRYQYFSDNPEDGKNKFIIFFKGCKLIADYIEYNNDEQNDVAALHAYKMMVLFGFNESKTRSVNPFLRVEEYLTQHVDQKSKQPIHDVLINNIPINHPDKKVKNLQGWRKFIQKYGRDAIVLFMQAQEIENVLNHVPLTKNEAINAAAKLKYARYAEYPELAEICHEYHVGEDDFNKCLEIEKIRKTSDNLPDIMIDGAEVGHPGYYLVKLPVDDMRAYILGHITDCCQSIGGESEKCVIDGITRKNNGFYVLLKINNPGNKNSQPMSNNKINYKDFTIVGQGYAWISRNKNLVFDSWENRRPESDDSIIVHMLRRFGELVIESSPEIIRVTIGNGGKTPDRFRWDTIKPDQSEQILEGHQYADSKKQCAVYSSHTKMSNLIKNLTEKWERLDKKPLDLGEIPFQQFASLDEMYSIEHAKRIERLFFQGDLNDFWGKADFKLAKKIDMSLLETCDIMHKNNILTFDLMRKIRFPILPVLHLLQTAGLETRENIMLCIDNIQYAYENVNGMNELNDLNYLTDDNLKTILVNKPDFQYIFACARNFKASGILNELTFRRIILPILIADLNGGPALDSLTKALSVLHRANISLNDKLIDKITYNDVITGLSVLETRELLVISNINLLLDNPDSAYLIANDMVNIKKILFKFINVNSEKLSTLPRDFFYNNASLVKASLQSLEAAIKLSQLLDGKGKIVLSDADKELLVSNDGPLCDIIPHVDKKVLEFLGWPDSNELTATQKKI